MFCRNLKQWRQLCSAGFVDVLTGFFIQHWWMTVDWADRFRVQQCQAISEPWKGRSEILERFTWMVSDEKWSNF